jgi:ABC-type sugar transport system substrate-binding protein
VQEDHGSGKRLIRARFTMRLRTRARLAVGLGLLAAALAAALDPLWGVGIAAAVLAATGVGWWSAARRGARAVAVFDHAASKLGLFRCEPGRNRQSAGTPGEVA